MSDISTTWAPALIGGDWSLHGSQLQSGNDLTTAILISIFTDRIAATDDVIPDGTNNPRGWWGDDPAHLIGSRLWLLDRSKQMTETLARAQGYIAEAIQWLIDDGVVAKFDIVTEWTRSGMIGAQIVAYEQSGAVIALNSSSVWSGLTAAPPGLHITI
jgi:phage gp46-like protein